MDIDEFVKYNRSENIKISNCLDIYNFEKNTKSFCEFCRNYERIITENKIYYSLNNFIFLLNLKGKEDINFEFEQEINLDEFVENKVSPLIYELNELYFMMSVKINIMFCAFFLSIKHGIY